MDSFFSVHLSSSSSWVSRVWVLVDVSRRLKGWNAAPDVVDLSADCVFLLLCIMGAPTTVSLLPRWRSRRRNVKTVETSAHDSLWGESTKESGVTRRLLFFNGRGCRTFPSRSQSRHRSSYSLRTIINRAQERTSGASSCCSTESSSSHFGHLHIRRKDDGRIHLPTEKEKKTKRPPVSQCTRVAGSCISWWEMNRFVERGPMETPFVFWESWAAPEFLSLSLGRRSGIITQQKRASFVK